MMSLCAFFSRHHRCPLCPPLSPSHAMRPLSFFILIAPRYAPIAPSSTSLSHCVLLVAVIVTLSRHCPLPLSSSLPPLGNCPRCPPSSSRSSSLPPLPPSHLVVTPSIPNIHHRRHASSFLNAAVPPAHSHVIVISRRSSLSSGMLAPPLPCHSHHHCHTRPSAFLLADYFPKRAQPSTQSVPQRSPTPPHPQRNPKHLTLRRRLW